MAYTPRQIVVRARETVAEIVRALERNRPVAGFLDGYARQHGRAAKTSHLGRYNELLDVIGREALLAMVSCVEAAAPQKLVARTRARKRPAKLKAELQILELFRKEFFVSLAEALEWNNEEYESFCHDLDLYERLGPRVAKTAKSKKLAASVGGAFVDRVGLLLDPSMFEKARRAAAEFQAQLEAAADRILRTVFSRRRN